VSIFPQGRSMRELARGNLAEVAVNNAEDSAIRLRIAIARIAQCLCVQTDELPVIGANFQALDEMARSNDCGWHALAAVCSDRALAMQEATAWNADGSRNTEYDLPQANTSGPDHLCGPMCPCGE